jgi:hypothetical protein
MNVKPVASGVAVLALLAFASASKPAQARGYGGHGGGWAPRFSDDRQFSSPAISPFTAFGIIAG